MMNQFAFCVTGHDEFNEVRGGLHIEGLGNDRVPTHAGVLVKGDPPARTGHMLGGGVRLKWCWPYWLEYADGPRWWQGV